MENRFKKGLILGGILAAVAGAVAGFAMTKEGQELTEELQKDLAVLAKHLRKNLHQLEDVTKEGFDQAVTTVVEEYAKKKDLAMETKDALIKALESKWHEMEAEYSSDKE